MCLDQIQNRKIPDSLKQGTGWKVFKTGFNGNPGLFFEYFNSPRYKPVVTDRWLTAAPKRVFGDTFWYNSGFHIWRTRKAARAYSSWTGNNRCVRKVEYCGATVFGRQNDHDVIVADKMFVISRSRG
jgi:hypothetical protein